MDVATCFEQKVTTMLNAARRAPAGAVPQQIFLTQIRIGMKLLLAAVWSCSLPSVLNAAEPIDFQRTIQPILAEHCLACHGPDEGARKADLRLDLRDSAVELNAIVPGNVTESELIARITATDPDTIMPPPAHKKPLRPVQIEALRQWVAEGASYSMHWAFAPPQRPEVPEVTVDPERPADALRTPLDRFALERLRREGLGFSPQAAPHTLCRRIYLDLVGLPPTPAEIDSFVAQARRDTPAAVDELITRLLASPHYGEKWARHWLDVARYADSNGYEKDLSREQWAWRDWVISALNRDLPYDQFLLEQIAGDMLPGRTQDQLVASGFFRNGMVNEEGAIVAEQFRMEGLFDRMDCVGKAALGLTLQCAQCHSHKFDPISQDEYYGLFAFLNNTFEAQSWVYTPAQQQQIDDLHKTLTDRETAWKATHPDWNKQLAAWVAEQQQSASDWQILTTVEQVWEGGLNHPEVLGDQSILILGHPTTSGSMYVTTQPGAKTITGVRIEALLHGDLPFGGPGRSYRGTFAISECEVSVRNPDETNWTKVKLSEATADFAEPEHELEAYFYNKGFDDEKKRRVGPAGFLIDADTKTAWRPDRGPILRHTESAAVIRFAEPLMLTAQTELKLRLTLSHGGSGNGRDNLQLGRMRFAITEKPDPKAPTYNHAATLALSKPADERTATDNAALFRAWRGSVAEFAAENEAVAKLEAQYPEAATSVLHIAEPPTSLRRKTFLLDRGGWDKPTHLVAPHVPAVLHPLSQTSGPNGTPTRLDFARWLVDERSPLTARVQVNRIWQAIFGAGLVETPEDFGTRAPQPELQNLLDWLAVDFMEHDWSQKHLIRQILSSAVYQQDSRVTPELLERDPRNRLLTRGPRFRVEAEVVRDIALSLAGLLDEKVGGPSIFPPVPESVLEYNYVKPAYWIPAEGSERYRRALYVFRKRSMPDPVLSSFDAPNGDVACAGRVRSNTPLAALVSLNETIFVEAARALALRILREGGTDDSTRASYAFRVCTGRAVKPAELHEVLTLLKQQRQRLAEGWLSINEVATGNATTFPKIPANTIPQDAAAWTIVARVLLNLDETLSKN